MLLIPLLCVYIYALLLWYFYALILIPMYIVFEWTVGTGKTTQSKLLVEYLKNLYPDREIIRVREPGTTPITEAIRTLVQWTHFDEYMHPVCEAYLYSASRCQLWYTIIKPALERWAIVISDRCFWSSMSYQWFAKWLSIETVREINRPIVESYIPDLVLFFDMPVEMWLSRTFDFTWDKHELNGYDFFTKAHEWYLQCVVDGRFAKQAVIIDALGTIEEVSQRVQSAIVL